MYERHSFLIQLLFYPFCLAGRNRTMFLIPKGFPWNITQKGSAFRTNIINLKLVGQIL